MSDWETWFQGEIIGEYVLGNSNLLSYLAGLSAKPTEAQGADEDESSLPKNNAQIALGLNQQH